MQLDALNNRNEYREGPKARETFDGTMKALFQVKKSDLKTALKPKRTGAPAKAIPNPSPEESSKQVIGELPGDELVDCRRYKVTVTHGIPVDSAMMERH